MADVTAGEGLAVSSPRKTFGQEAVALWRRVTSRRQRSEVVVPVATGEDARVDDAVVEEIVAKAALTRENFADASVEEIVEFLKGLDVEPTEGAERPEAERGEFGFFGVKLTDDEKAAVLRLRTGAPAVEGEEDTTEADVALLKAKFAIPASSEAVVDEVAKVVSPVEETGEAVAPVDEAAEAAALASQNRAELLGIVDKFALVQKDRAALAILATVSELSSEAQREVDETLAVLWDLLGNTPIERADDGETVLPVRLSEAAESRLAALIAALEATQRQASAPVEQAQALAVEENDRQEEEVAVVEGVDDEVREGETNVVVAVEAGDDHVGDNRAD